MSTATQTERTVVHNAGSVRAAATSAAIKSGAGVAEAGDARERYREYRCECGHAMRVSGGGRHRVYFELMDVRLTDPVMDRKCKLCGRGLPGKNQPS